MKPGDGIVGLLAVSYIYLALFDGLEYPVISLTLLIVIGIQLRRSRTSRRA